MIRLGRGGWSPRRPSTLSRAPSPPPARLRVTIGRHLMSTGVSAEMSTPQVRASQLAEGQSRSPEVPEQSRSAKPRRSTCRAPDLDGSEVCQWTQWNWPPLWRPGGAVPSPVAEVAPERSKMRGGEAVRHCQCKCVHRFTGSRPRRRKCVSDRSPARVSACSGVSDRSR